ncbi:MAG: DUF2442 domain-containing protein [Sulfobacillus sp.]
MTAQHPPFHGVIEARAIKPYLLQLKFDDGTSRLYDATMLVNHPGALAEPLRDWPFFAKVEVDPDAATVAWPNGLLIDPAILYRDACLQPIVEYGTSNRQGGSTYYLPGHQKPHVIVVQGTEV